MIDLHQVRYFYKSVESPTNLLGFIASTWWGLFWANF